MEALFFLAFFAVFAAIVAVALVAGAQQTKKLSETYARLAARFEGTSHAGGLFQRPSARFTYNGAHVLVDIYSTGGKHPTYYTQVHIGWPDRGFRCEVYRSTFFTRVGKFLGMGDIEIGAPQFDEDYQITGNDSDAIKQLLTAGVQGRIHQIRLHNHNDHVYILISGGTLLVKKLGLIGEFDPLARLVVLSLELYEEALSTRSGGIEFVEATAPAQGPPVCQVCGDAIAGDLVQCKSCKTPHHKECWTYYGACSTYGCGEKRYITPRRDPLRRAS